MSAATIKDQRRTTKLPWWWWILTGGAALVGLVGLLRQTAFGSQRRLFHQHGLSNAAAAAAASASPVNATLDFASIFVVHQKHRWNRRDEMSLMAAATGLTLTYADAPRPFELSYNGLPWHPQEEVRATELAQFRAHADVWRHMVENNVASAWIVEDDSDWDEAIKQQFGALKAPLARLLGSAAAAAGPAYRRQLYSADPYRSRTWDVIFTGSCSEESSGSNDDDSGHSNDNGGDDDASMPPATPLLGYHDDTVAGCEQLHPGHQKWMLAMANATGDEQLACVPWLAAASQQQRRVRIVARARSPRCLTSYAISHSGATKALFYLSRGLTARLDEALAHLVELDLLNALTVVPALTSTWTVQDPTGHNNPSRGHSIGLRSGIRRHLRRALFG